MNLLRSVFKLGSANIALLGAQAVTVLSLGVIIDPDAFAIFILGLSIAQIFSVFATMRFDSALPSARSKHELGALLTLSIASIIIVVALEFVSILMLRSYDLFELQIMPSWAVAIILLLTATLASTQLGRFWAIRHNQLKTIEKATYLRAALTALLRLAVIIPVLAGFESETKHSAGVVLLTAELIIVSSTAFLLLRKIDVALIRPKNRTAAKIFVTLRRNWKFPSLETPSAMLDSMALNAPVFIVTQFFGLSATASFGLAFRAIAVPIGQLALALTEVMQTRYSELLRAKRPGKMRTLFYHSSLLMLAGGVVGSVLIYLLFEDTVILMFGSKMAEFASICVIIFPWVAMNVMVNINSRLLPLLRRQELKLVYDAFSIVAIPVIVVIQTQLNFNLFGLVTLMTASQIVGYVIYWALIRSAVADVAR